MKNYLQTKAGRALAAVDFDQNGSQAVSGIVAWPAHQSAGLYVSEAAQGLGASILAAA